MKLRSLALAIALGIAPPALATSITSAEITLATVNPLALGCLDHCVVGVCIWLRPIATPPFFKVETTIRVKHKFPDIVVSVFENPGDNPWLDVRGFSALAGQAAGQIYGSAMGTRMPIIGGGRHTPAANQVQGQGNQGYDVRREQIRFGEAEIYGHPLASVISQQPLGFGVRIPGLCPVNTRSLQPYYQSGFDVLSWRNPEVELLYPGTWIPYYREVRNSTFTEIWGSVFPRNGLLAGQSDPFKAAAVFAQRAADIATNRLQPHVYLHAPGAAADERADYWQQLAPRTRFICGPFGNSGYLLPNTGTVANVDDDQVWQLWRPYECCLSNDGAIHVTTVNAPAICLSSIL